jgi:hypothetical protein
LQLQERLVEVAASAFIRQTRFDPRRKAETEQHLYDALPKALQALARSPETNIEVNGYRARVVAADMVNAGQRLFTGAAEAMGSLSPADQLITDPLVALLPGMADKFPQASVAAADELWQATQQHGDKLIHRGAPISFVTTLPCLASDNNGPIEPVSLEPIAAPVTQPTHVLHGASARPLSENMELSPGLTLSKVSGSWYAQGSARVNGSAASAELELAAGDTVAASDGTEFQLIEVIA